MYKKRYSKKFKKSFRKLMRSGNFDSGETERVIDLIASGIRLPEKHRDHALQGEFAEMRECHIEPNLLLMYQIEKEMLVLILINIGSHSDLFK